MQPLPVGVQWVLARSPLGSVGTQLVLSCSPVGHSRGQQKLLGVKCSSQKKMSTRNNLGLNDSVRDKLGSVAVQR